MLLHSPTWIRLLFYILHAIYRFIWRHFQPVQHGLCSADVTFFHLLTVPLETSYLRLYWTDLHQILRIGTYIWARMINPLFFKRSPKGRNLYGNRFFGANRQKLAYSTTVDGRIATRMLALTPPTTRTSDKNLVNFGPGGLHTGLCHAVSFSVHYKTTPVRR